MAVDYGVRQGLLSKGYTNDDIGYDQNTGYVQVKGQNFIKPELNMSGTTYTSRQNFDNAYNQLQKNQRDQQQQQLTDQYIQQATNPTPKVNPYADQYTQLIGQIQNIMNRPTQDPYSTPQYAAAQAQAQRSAQQGIRAAQESLGSAGFGRSTALGNAAQRAQNDANEYLMTQVVPSIQSQIQAQRQAEIANQMNLLNPVMALMNREDTMRAQQNQDLRSTIDFINNLSQQDFNNERVLNQEGLRNRQANIEAASMVGQQLGRVLQPKSDWNNLYNQENAPLNMQAQAAELAQKNLEDEKVYRRERDNEEDKRWWSQYEQDGRKFAASQGLQWAQLNQRQREFLADQAYKNAALARENDPNSLDNQYKQAQIDSMRSKIEPQQSGIDEYDLLVVEDMAKQRGVNLNRPKPEQVRSFVASMKGQYGWSVDETKAVENYLMSKGSSSTKSTKDKAAQQQAVNVAKSTIYSQNPYQYPWQR